MSWATTSRATTWRHSLVPLLVVAILTFSCASDEGGSGSTPSGPSPVVRLALAPESATVNTGGTVTFAASAVHGDGSTSSASVTWTATGGTITPSGQYTAGPAAGSFEVTASQVGGSLTKSAPVTVVASTSPIASISVSPNSATVAAGGTVQFSVLATRQDGTTLVPDVTWTATGGAITAGGLYRAGSTPGTFNVTATQQGGTLAGTAAVTVSAAVLEAVVLTPASATLTTGATQQFSVSGRWSDGSTRAPAVTYSATGGTITAGGLYTAGSTAGTFTVTATQQGGTLAATATVTISAAVLEAIILSPSSVTLTTGAKQQFSVSGRWSNGATTAPAVTYSATGGSITAGGLYTAGATPGSFTVTATQQGGTLAATASVTINAPVLQAVILTPSSAMLTTGATQQFSVSGRWSDGSTTALAVNYTATGGTITAGGLYTAGSTPGTFIVTATQQGGTLSATAAVTITAPSTGNRYSTNFPLTENPISEGGRWINGGSVGLDWTNVRTTPGQAFGTQSGASYTDSTALLTGVWGPDQEVTATVYTASPPAENCYPEVELRLRSAIASRQNRGYEIAWKVSQTGAAYLLIVRWNGGLGDFTYLKNWADYGGAQYGVRNGDVVSAKIVGNTIYAYKNGALQGTATDSVWASGAPGIGFNLENGPAGCSGTNSTYGFKALTATDTR